MSVTKVDLVNAVREDMNLLGKDAAEAVELVLSTLKETLGERETVKLSGFGTFLVKKRGERKGRNLKTGEEIPVKPRWCVTFKPGDQLKHMVDNEH